MLVFERTCTYLDCMAAVIFQRTDFEPGGGDFTLSDLTLGVFLNDQPEHRLALGSDRSSLIPLTKDQGWVLPAGSEGLCEFDAPLQAVTVSFDKMLLEEVGLDRPDLIAPHIGAFDALTRQLVLNMEGLKSASALYRETMWRALASHLVQTGLDRSSRVVPIDDKRLRRALEFIEANIGQDMSLDDLATVAGMSAYHFARCFKAAVGQSPLQYVIESRIDRSRMLLKTTDLTITEIAFRTGFEDASRFGRHFKRRVGVTPGAFREL